MEYSVKKNGELIPSNYRNKVSQRYRVITKVINEAFWNSTSEKSHSFYVGSYGRHTAVNTSDIDVLVEIPGTVFDSLEYNAGNIPSRFLQKIKNPIVSHYSNSDVRADGQIIKINFYDGIKFEILPAFLEKDYFGNEIYYKYPDSNKGGSWRPTNPKKEQQAMYEENKYSNDLLFNTCRHIRSLRDEKYSSYKLPGIFIDSFVYNFLNQHLWFFSNDGNKSSISFELTLYRYFQENVLGEETILAPGSRQKFDIDDEYKYVLERILYLMAYGD